jgi:hypothetical protein
MKFTILVDTLLPFITKHLFFLADPEVIKLLKFVLHSQIQNIFSKYKLKLKFYTWNRVEFWVWIQYSRIYFEFEYGIQTQKVLKLLGQMCSSGDFSLILVIVWQLSSCPKGPGVGPEVLKFTSYVHLYSWIRTCTSYQIWKELE